MFKDYYKILEINFESTETDIKTAFKLQAFKWHPDRNSGSDTLINMQDINEAYLILKDSEAKAKYDIEYFKYKAYLKNQSKGDEASENQEYQFTDDLLKRWINNARKQAINIVSDSLKEFKIGVKAAGEEMFERAKYFIIAGLLFTILFSITKGCN